MAEDNDAQITCRFSTKLPSKYRVPLSEIAVPSKLTRYGLSQVINHLLDLDESVPFDFLVNGQLVRQPLDKFLLAQSISAESVLEVEYIFAATPPSFKEQVLHDDWVSALDGSMAGQIFSGCYDGMLRIWDGAGNKLGEAGVHTGPISSLQHIKGREPLTMLSTGKFDHIARLLQVPSDPAKLRREGVTCIAAYKGHGGSIMDAAASPDTDRFVSASQDKTLRIWPTGQEVIDSAAPELEASQKKKRKASSGRPIDVLAQGVEVEHVLELQGHRDAVTSTVWADPDRIYSGSMDHSVRLWDAETGTNVDTLHCKKAVYGISLSPGSPQVIAFVGAARALNLWDARQKHTDSPAFKSFMSHTSFIHAVEWRPNSEHQVATGSLDKTSKVWDVRTPIPLSTLEGHTEQVLCLAWWDKAKLVSGSADNTLRVYDTELQAPVLSR